ncbi:MAG TPA: thiol-disulfide oxidoreductase DCC family protein [Bacilli bacterium]|nr:thiol-disulfide oxidoreductase DCC family protein [Bacilli bacterium]
MSATQTNIVLFDGVCNLCNSTVQFLIKHDPAGRLKFASLQSEQGRRLLEQVDGPRDLQSIVLVDEQGRWYAESTAVLRICRSLQSFWKMGYGLLLIPRPLRDAAYRWLARRRYRFFGKQETCMIPTPEMQKRFL